MVETRMTAPVTAYGTLTDFLRSWISEGKYGPDGRMPTEEELARVQGVSRQTVRRAYQTLVQEGLIHRTRGRGTFVTPVQPDGRYLRTFGSLDDLMAQAADSTTEPLTPMRAVTDGRLSKLLRCEGVVGTMLLRRSQEGKIVAVSQVSVPEVVMEAIRPWGEETGYAEGTVLDAISRVWGSRIRGAKQRMTAGLCNETDAEHLECQPGEPVLEVERRYYDDDGEFVELTESRYVGRRFTYRLELLRSFQ
jgi:GntR family transcriptional regulator